MSWRFWSPREVAEGLLLLAREEGVERGVATWQRLVAQRSERLGEQLLRQVVGRERGRHGPLRFYEQ